jgi:1,4-alpha-glucan branching enzyme
MIHKQLASTCEKVRVTFELPSCLWADRIFVVGDFNQWRHHETPLNQDREGVWRAVIDLPVGRQYQFLYLIDGKWQQDQGADGACPNELGSENSILDTSLFAVETRRREVSRTALINTPKTTQLRLAKGNGRLPHTQPVRISPGAE